MSRLHLTTPRADGFRMPGAIEPKTRCWMIWPERTDEYPYGARPAQKAFARVATAIATSDPLTMLASQRQFKNARAYPMLANHAQELAAGASPVAIFSHAIGWDWLAIVVDVLLVPATLAATVTLYNVGARIIATTAADGLLPASLSRVHPKLHTPYVAVGALAVVATVLTVLLQVSLRKSPLMTSVYLANLTTYYWLAPYAVVCIGILRVLRRERARDVATVSSAVLAMAAIVYVAVELFRSPVDAGTKYLPYLAVVSITAVALAFLATRRDAAVPESEVEQL